MILRTSFETDGTMMHTPLATVYATWCTFLIEKFQSFEQGSLAVMADYITNTQHMSYWFPVAIPCFC